ncbi:hypothetical protein HAX54_048471, partial [Datura stramonium]|nr:hypothetical protein [Datura stramonium]
LTNINHQVDENIVILESNPDSTWSSSFDHLDESVHSSIVDFWVWSRPSRLLHDFGSLHYRQFCTFLKLPSELSLMKPFGGFVRYTTHSPASQKSGLKAKNSTP